MAEVSIERSSSQEKHFRKRNSSSRWRHQNSITVSVRSVSWGRTASKNTTQGFAGEVVKASCFSSFFLSFGSKRAHIKVVHRERTAPMDSKKRRPLNHEGKAAERTSMYMSVPRPAITAQVENGTGTSRPAQATSEGATLMPRLRQVGRCADSPARVQPHRTPPRKERIEAP